MAIKVNDKFPTDVTLKYIPYTKENDSIVACANPIGLSLSKFADQKIILTSFPGSFTPTCTEQHIPDYLEHAKEFKAKGVDRVVAISANDPFVNAAWSKALGNKDEENYFIFATDPNAQLSKELGEEYVADLTSAGFGVRTARYTAIIDKGVITFIKIEDGNGFGDATSAKTLLSNL